MPSLVDSHGNYHPEVACQQEQRPDRDEVEDGCAICGAPLDDGEGYDGLCGTCSDKLED